MLRKQLNHIIFLHKVKKAVCKNAIPKQQEVKYAVAGNAYTVLFFC
jgi:hypothetical protein